MSGDLGVFEGLAVLGIGVAVTKAGDGLSKAMEVEPVDLHIGDRGTISIGFVVEKVGFTPIKDTDGVRRVVTLAAEGAALTTGVAGVQKALDKVQRAVDEQLGSGKSKRTVSAEEGSE